MSEWRVVSCVIFGDTFYSVYRDDKNDVYYPRRYAGRLFESETLAQEYADKLNKEKGEA